MDWRLLFVLVFVLHHEITKASHNLKMPKIKYKINYIRKKPPTINRVMNLVRRHRGHRDEITFLKEARALPDINSVIPAWQIRLDREHEKTRHNIFSHRRARREPKVKYSEMVSIESLPDSRRNDNFIRRALELSLGDRIKEYRNANNKRNNRPRHAEEGLNTEELSHPGNNLFSLKSKTLLGAAKFPKKKPDHAVYGNLDTLGISPEPRRPLKRRPRVLNAARNPELLFDPDHPGLSLVNSKNMILGAARFGRQGRDKDTSVYGNLENLGIRYEKEPSRFKYSDFRRANQNVRKYSPRKSSPRKSYPRKSAPQKYYPRKSAPRKSYPWKSAPRKSYPRKSAPQKYYPRKSAPQKSTVKPNKKPKKEEERPSLILFIDGKNTQELYNKTKYKKPKTTTTKPPEEDENKSHFSYEYSYGRRSKSKFSRIGAREPYTYSKRYDRSYEVPIRPIFVSKITGNVKPKTRPAPKRFTGQQYHTSHNRLRPKKKTLSRISRTRNSEAEDEEVSQKKKIESLLSKDSGKLVYGNLENLGIRYGKEPYFTKYTDFRKQNRKDYSKNDVAFRESNAIISLLNDASHQTRYNIQSAPVRKYNTKIIVDAVLRAIKNSNDVNSHLYYKGGDLVTQAAVGPSDLSAKNLNFRPLKDFLNSAESDTENNDDEILDESDGSSEEEDYFRRRSKYHDRDKNYDKKKSNCSSEKSDSTDGSSSSDEKNPGNPYTIFKNKYKQNWLWNHAMTGDHMNVNPYGPKFDSLGPSGPELFFGRKWWYFNQDDYKPFRR